MAKKKTSSTKNVPADSRTLTQEDREKIQRLLETTEPENVRLAIELTEETCGDAELKEIFTDQIILSLVSSGDIELLAITASFFLRHKEHWERFIQCAHETNVLTRTVVINRAANLWDFTAITTGAAKFLADNHGRAELNGLVTISFETAVHLAKCRDLSLNGLTSLPGEIAAELAKHNGNRLELNGLTELPDAAIESLGSCERDLSLCGLTSLSDAAAKSLGSHKGELRLDGITQLSEPAAKYLAQHEDGISLCGLTDLSNQAALAFTNKEALRTNESIDKQIAEATKNYAATSATLTPAQRGKIKKLINIENLPTACELLQSTGAQEGDWLSVFSKSKIKALVNSWDPETWDIMVAQMKPFPKVYELLKNVIEERINYDGSDPSVYVRFGESLGTVLTNGSDDLKSLIDTLLTSRGMRRQVEL